MTLLPKSGIMFLDQLTTTVEDIECIDGIEAMLTRDEFIGYLRGNSMKYRWRFPYKNGTEDLKKAEWYEKRLLRILESNG
jgi:hypothetical protein